MYKSTGYGALIGAQTGTPHGVYYIYVHANTSVDSSSVRAVLLSQLILFVFTNPLITRCKRFSIKHRSYATFNPFLARFKAESYYYDGKVVLNGSTHAHY